MSRLFVITLGFEEKYVVRMLTRYGVGPEDLLLVFTGPRTQMSEKAVRILADFLSKYYESTSLEVVETKPADGFGQLLEKMYEEVSGRAGQYDEVVFNLSGGMRVLCLAALMTAQLLSALHSKVRVELETEDSSALIPVPRAAVSLPLTLAELTAEKLEVLREISHTPTTAKTISARLGKDESSVRKHLATLTSLGLAETIGERPRKYIATPTGRTVAKALQKKT